MVLMKWVSESTLNFILSKRCFIIKNKYMRFYCLANWPLYLNNQRSKTRTLEKSKGFELSGCKQAVNLEVERKIITIVTDTVY